MQRNTTLIRLASPSWGTLMVRATLLYQHYDFRFHLVHCSVYTVLMCYSTRRVLVLFADELPTCASLTALHRLLHVGQLYGHLRHDFVLVGHRDVAKTECPGEHLYSALPKLKTSD